MVARRPPAAATFTIADPRDSGKRFGRPGMPMPGGRWTARDNTL